MKRNKRGKRSNLFLLYIKYLRKYERVVEEYKREAALTAALIELKTGKEL